MVPIERPQAVEVWHTESPFAGGDAREDRLLAVSVAVSPRYRVPVYGAEPAVEWPSPVLVRPHAAS
jgi:hypothetical protein